MCTLAQHFEVINSTNFSASFFLQNFRSLVFQIFMDEFEFIKPIFYTTYLL